MPSQNILSARSSPRRTALLPLCLAPIPLLPKPAGPPPGSEGCLLRDLRLMHDRVNAYVLLAIAFIRETMWNSPFSRVSDFRNLYKLLPSIVNFVEKSRTYMLFQ